MNSLVLNGFAGHRLKHTNRCNTYFRFSKWLGCFEIEPVIPIGYCTGVGVATSGIANPLTWVQIPACALVENINLRIALRAVLISKDCFVEDIKWARLV